MKVAGAEGRGRGSSHHRLREPAARRTHLARGSPSSSIATAPPATRPPRRGGGAAASSPSVPSSSPSSGGAGVAAPRTRRLAPPLADARANFAAGAGAGSEGQGPDRPRRFEPLRLVCGPTRSCSEEARPAMDGRAATGGGGEKRLIAAAATAAWAASA